MGNTEGIGGGGEQTNLKTGENIKGFLTPYFLHICMNQKSKVKKALSKITVLS